MSRNLTISTFLLLGLVATPATSSASSTIGYGPVVNNGYGIATITSGAYRCSRRKFHGALDIAARCGKHMKAMLAGKRYYKYSGGYRNTCGRMTSNYGNYNLSVGRNGYRFIEAHANRSARFGGRARYYRNGQSMNYVGSTGHSTGPHVHAGNLRSWTKITGWLNSYTSAHKCGRHPNKTTRIGRPRIS